MKCKNGDYVRVTHSLSLHYSGLLMVTDIDQKNRPIRGIDPKGNQQRLVSTHKISKSSEEEFLEKANEKGKQQVEIHKKSTSTYLHPGQRTWSYVYE